MWGIHCDPPLFLWRFTMATTVDSLEVKISTTIGDCNQKLDRLIGKLSQVSKALKMIQDGKTFEPFTEESRKAEASAKRLQNVSNKVIRSYEEIKKASDSIVKASQDKAGNFVSASSVAQIRDRLKTIQNAYDNAKVKLSKIDLTPKNVNKYESATKDVIAYESELERLKTLLSEIETRDAERTKKHNATTQSNGTAEELEREQRYLEEVRNKANESAKALGTVSNANRDIAQTSQEAVRPIKTWGTVISDAKEVMASVGYSAKTFADNIIISMRGAKPSTEDWKDSVRFLGLAFQDLSMTARDTFDVIKNGNAKTVFKDFGEKVAEVGTTMKTKIVNTFDNMISKSREVKSSFAQGLVDKGILTYTEKYASLRKELDKTRQHLSDLKYQQERFLATGGSVTNTTYKKYAYDIDTANKELNKLAKTMDELESKNQVFSVNTQTFKNAFSGLQKIGDGVTKTFTGVFGTIGKVGSAIKGAVGHLGSLHSSTTKAKKSTDKFNLANVNLAKSLFKTTKMLKLMITRMILRKIISGVTDGFKNLAQYSDKVNASMSLLWNSFRQLGNSIATAVSPLLNAFAPALNKIIQLVVTATNYINQFLSALTGLSTWTRAKTLTDSYADSLDKTSKSAKNANKQLQSFDALNNLTSKDNSSTTSPADMFEEEDIDEKVKNFTDKVKDVFNDLFEPLKKAWNNMGSFFVDSFKTTAKKLKDLFAEIGKDFMEVWGEWETQKMFENILIIISRIVRTVGILADKFKEAWKYNKNGLRILRSIRDVLATIVEWVLRMVEATESWAKKLDLKPLLSAIAGYMESLNRVIDNVMRVMYGFYTTVLLKFSKWTLEKGLPQFFDIMKKFNTEVKWENIAEKINAIWVALEPFAEKIGQGLINFFGYLMDKLTEFLNSGLLDKILDCIAEFLNFLTNFDWGFDLSSLNGSFTSYLDSLIPVIEDVKGILEDLMDEVVKPMVKWVVEDGLPLLLSKLQELNESGLITSVRDALSDLWEVLTPFAQTVGEGLIIFIGNMGEKLNDFLMSPEWDKFIDSLERWTKNVDAEEVAHGLEVICTALLGYKALTFLSSVLTAITTFLNFIKDSGSAVANGFLAIRSGMHSVTSFMTSTEWVSFTNFLTSPMSVIGISKAVDMARGTFLDPDEWKGLFGKLFDYFGIIWNDIFATPFNMFDAIFGTNSMESVGFKWETFEEYNKAIEKLESAGKSTAGTYDEIIARANSLAETSVSNLTDVSENIDNIGGSIQVTAGASKTFMDSMNNISTSTKKTYESIELETSNLNISMDTDWKEITKTVDDSSDTIKKDAEKIIENFTEDKWTLDGVKDGLSKTFENALKVIKEKWNSFAKWLNEKAQFEIEPIEIAGKQITEGGKIELFHIPTYSTGGFPEDGLLFANHGEMAGRFSNGKSVVANNEQIVEGIASGVASANSEQNTLLREQNALLQGILNKEFGISSDAIFSSVQRSANSYYKRTGNYAF